MITIQEGDVDIGELIAAAKTPGTGAIVVFDGIVRNDNIRSIEVEAYREAAVPELERLAREATEKFRLLHVDIVHRTGRLGIGETIVAIVVSAGHREEAYEGSRFIIEGIKAAVPIWKKELTGDGGRWVPGDHAHGSAKTR